MSVLDVSVVLKWFIDEPSSDKAVRLKEEYYAGRREIIVPDLLLYEVVNVLRYNKDFASQEIKEAIKTLFDMEIDIMTPSYSLLVKAVNLARRFDVTCYDAAYLALAEELGQQLFTADKILHDKAKEIIPIELLL